MSAAAVLTAAISSSILFVLALFGGIELVRRGRLSPKMAAVALALAAASPPWIVRALGLPWDLPFALLWSLIVFVIVAFGSARAFRGIARVK